MYLTNRPTIIYLFVVCPVRIISARHGENIPDTEVAVGARSDISAGSFPISPVLLPEAR